jgi:lipopolysaccharide exporter
MPKASLLNSIKWNYLGAIMKGVLQMGVLAILARLISPEEFGLMALALVAIKFGRYFSDFGLAAAIQQKKEINKSDIEASFWFSFLAGLIFTILVGVLANPLANFFESPKLEPIIQIVAFSFVIIGASSTSIGLIKREMRFKFLSITETTAYLISNGMIGIFLAYKGYGVYSLAIAHLSLLLLTFIATYSKTRHSIRINLKLSDYKHILKFGGGYSIASFMSFIGSNIDHILIGKFFPASELGLWNRSRNIISMPSYNLLVSITGALLPAYSKHQHDLDKFRDLYIKSLAFTGFLLLPIGGGMFAAAPQLIDVLLGSSWHNALIYVQLSSLFVPVEMLASIAATACSALGAISIQVRLQSYLLLLFVPIMLYFSFQNQIIYILITLATYYWIRFIIYLIILSRKLKINFITHFEIILSQVMASIWVGTLIYLTSYYFSFLNAFQLLPLEIISGGIGLSTFILFGPAKACRKTLREFLNLRSSHAKIIKSIKIILKKEY